ncbi:MAG TPA: hypothetical protein VFN78_07430 [Ktedonobacterales bacterium]|nr:hypothetical protein [Ktedonobacterales bacterium]
MADEPIEESTERAEPSDSARVVDSEDERYRGATPPGYDWPTHGGYLGCLLGVMIACLLAPLGYIVFGFVGAFLVHPLGGVGIALAVIITVGAYLAVFVALTRLGWSMGKRFLREYEQPMRPVWGEDDEEDYPLVVDADPASSATEAPASEASLAEPDQRQTESAG